jgi:hypothetical protein
MRMTHRRGISLSTVVTIPESERRSQALGNDSLRLSRPYLILRLLERTINVVLGLPHPRHTLFIVSEPFLKVVAQLGEDGGVSCMLVDFQPEREPGALAEDGQEMVVLLVGAVET